MNGGAGGFGGAPVTKGLLAAVGTASLLHAVRGGGAPTGLLGRTLAFASAGELIFGAALLYHGRLLERRSGSNAYGSAAALATAVGGTVAALVGRLVRARPASGPLPLLFANLASFALDVPPLTPLANGRASNKAFIHAAAAQLALLGGRGGLVAAVGGLVAGAALRADVGGLASLRFPSTVTSFLARTLGPLLGRPVADCTVVPPPDTPGAPPPAWATVAAEPPAEAVRQLVAMGFGESEARAALRRRGGDVAAALAELLPG